jgi:hypothetical protein
MFTRRIVLLGTLALLVGLFGPGAAFASVKCQCNNGVIEWDMGADPDDDDVEESCNDTCSDMGGGTVWNVDDDDDDDDGDTTIVRPRRGNAAPRR